MKQKRIVISFIVFVLSCSLSACRMDTFFSGQGQASVSSSETVLNERDELIQALYQNAKQTGTLVPVRLDYVVDGDTINVLYDETSFRVRLIGVNAEESVASDTYLEQTNQENTAAGKEASDFVKELLPKACELYLEFDEELFDKYHRVLAYVWIAEDRSNSDNMVQIRLLREGHAELMTVKPNTKYQELLAEYIR